MLSEDDEGLIIVEMSAFLSSDGSSLVSATDAALAAAIAFLHRLLFALGAGAGSSLSSAGRFLVSFSVLTPGEDFSSDTVSSAFAFAAFPAAFDVAEVGLATFFTLVFFAVSSSSSFDIFADRNRSERRGGAGSRVLSLGIDVVWMKALIAGEAE